jgi:hypothetical protein
LQDRQVWVESIELVINDCRQQQKTATTEKILNDTPPRVRLFDDEGEKRFREEIGIDMENIYPSSGVDPESGDPFTLSQHIDAANDIAGYLADFVPELQKSGLRAARYDVLAVTLDLVNDALTDRLAGILSPSHELIYNAQKLGDLHKVIMFLTTYQQQMSTTICPTKPGAQKPPTHFELLDRLPAMCQRYVNGDAKGRGAPGAAALLVDSCHNTLSELLKQPVEMIQQQRDGTFFTNAPTEIWSTLNQHLELAIATRSPVLQVSSSCLEGFCACGWDELTLDVSLQVMIADKISIALKHIIDMISKFVRELDTTKTPELKVGPNIVCFV